ncbi:MAG TPA: CaiB/BaiF CoA-transferase family protein [Hyphomicrobiaceae bacterium]|nr:CaiB/BaiF CoA-transferase family protein [Hyphomicrobiaceae bacterium]
MIVPPAATTATLQPLAGVRVIEISQLVMGPSCGLILADLGADVIKVEPPGGDRTRFFQGNASGFFATYCRNKRSLAIDTSSREGREVLLRLVRTADVFIENFRPGLLERQGLGHAALSAVNPRLVYCSLKGYLPGPYENRLALDEVVQMMGGLAYMTGPPGQPLRAGASINDIMGGMFGVIAIQAALTERAATGRGRHIQSALFENNVFLMAQMMMYEAINQKPQQTFAIKSASWPVYDLFETSDGKQIFIAIVGEDQWRAFCERFDRRTWLTDPRFASKQTRIDNRPTLIPEIAVIAGQYDAATLSGILETLELPYAPVNTPSALFDDPHLNASGGFHTIDIGGGRQTVTPGLPLAIDGHRLPNHRNPPRIGEHTHEILREIGYDAEDIDRLAAANIVSRDQAVVDNSVAPS